MQGSILPIDYRGCGRGRPPLSLTRTITIDPGNTGSPSTSTNAGQERISIATACRPWIQDSSYDFDETPPRIAGIRQRCKEYFLKLADNTAVYFYIICVMAIIFISFLIYLLSNCFSNCKRNDRLIVQLFHKIFLHCKHKFVNPHVVCRHVRTCILLKK